MAWIPITGGKVYARHVRGKRAANTNKRKRVGNQSSYSKSTSATKGFAWGAAAKYDPSRRLGCALGGALGGEMYRKRRAFSRPAFYLDASAVILDDALADRQS